MNTAILHDFYNVAKELSRIKKELEILEHTITHIYNQWAGIYEKGSDKTRCRGDIEIDFSSTNETK